MPVRHQPVAPDLTEAPPDRLAIGSLNMAAEPRIADDLATWVRARRFDVLLLQEVGNDEVDGADFVTQLADRLGYEVAYAPANVMDNTETQGLAILSRLPLGDIRVYPFAYHQLRFKSRCRIALGATVPTAAGLVRVTNVHLDTRINSDERVAQLTPLLDALDGTAGPQLIGGDFNTMDIYWWQTMWPVPNGAHQAEAVRTELAARGFHTPFVGGRPTFKFMGLPIHLDWIYLKQLDALEWNVDDVPITDHRGVWARVVPAG